MSTVSQWIVMIMQYAGIAGIFVFGMSVLSISDIRKKVVFFFLILLSTVMLSYVFYPGTTFFISAFGAIFVFLIINQLVNHLHMINSAHGGNAGQGEDSGTGTNKINYFRLLNIVIPVFLCGIAFYLGYHYLHDFQVTWKDLQDIPAAGTKQMAGQIFGYYGVLVIILFSALFISLIWFTIILGSGQEKKGGDKDK